MTWARARRGLVLALSLVLALASLVPVLRIRFDTDVLQLMPRESGAVDAFETYLERFGSLDALYVYVEAPESGAVADYRDYVDTLADALRLLPDVKRVDTGLLDATRDWTYLTDRQLLLLDDRSFEEAAGAHGARPHPGPTRTRPGAARPVHAGAEGHRAARSARLVRAHDRPSAGRVRGTASRSFPHRRLRDRRRPRSVAGRAPDAAALRHHLRTVAARAHRRSRRACARRLRTAVGRGRIRGAAHRRGGRAPDRDRDRVADAGRGHPQHRLVDGRRTRASLPRVPQRVAGGLRHVAHPARHTRHAGGASGGGRAAVCRRDGRRRHALRPRRRRPGAAVRGVSRAAGTRAVADRCGARPRWHRCQRVPRRHHHGRHIPRPLVHEFPQPAAARHRRRNRHAADGALHADGARGGLARARVGGAIARPLPAGSRPVDRPP